MLELTILHTNDMHGRLEAMARLSAFARRVRAEAEAQGRFVLLWDAGDAADRREKLSRATKGSAISPILNVMGYTLQTLGNDIALPYGPQAMADVAAHAAFPILGANFRNGQGPLVEGLRESVLVPLSDEIKLGVLGLTAPWDGLYKIFGLDLPDTHDIARACVARLQAAGAAPIIVLSHLGLEGDRLLAEQVQGIDVIIGAHSHNLLPHGEIHANILIAQAGQYAEALGRIDLTLDETGRIIQHCAEVLPVPAAQAPDPLVLQAIALGEVQVNTLMAHPVGVLSAPLDLNHFDECGIGALGADALRERMNAQVALLASGLFHQGLPQGTITRGDLSAACFSTANPAATTLRGEQLRAALERGLDPAVSHLEHGSFRGTPMGIPQISGMSIEYCPEAPTGSRISSIEIDGELLASERLYRVAHTDAESDPDIGYFVPGADQPTESEVPTILGEVLEAYIARHSPVPAPTMPRWRRIPCAGTPNRRLK